jgi:hypothetical protein
MNKTVIEFDNTRVLIPFQKHSGHSYLSPIADVLVSNPINGKSVAFTSKFLIDTGASISILNRGFNDFILDSEPTVVDHVRIVYGTGNAKSLPIYNLRFSIKGHTLDIHTAHDKDLLIHNLIGMYGFINRLDGLIVHPKSTKRVSLWQ